MRHEGHLEGLAAENARMSQELERLQEAFENVRRALCVFDQEGASLIAIGAIRRSSACPPKRSRPALSVRELIGMAMEAGYYDSSLTAEEIEESLAEPGP